MGFSWAIIRPLFSMVVFSVIFGHLANIPSDGTPYPIFSYAALVPWIYFSTAMTNSTQSLIGNAGMLTKIYFPRLIIPLTPVLAGLVDFGIAFSLLFGMMFWYGISPSIYALCIPYLIMLMMLSAAGIGMWLSALAIQYRDIKHAIGFLAQIMMYAAPVVWPLSLLPESYRLWYGLYPMAAVIEGFRASLIHTTSMPWDLILVGSISATLLFLSGAFYFRRMETIFADVA